MRAMPCGPLVMLIGRDRLLRKMRMISPKPSVTMAQLERRRPQQEAEEGGDRGADRQDDPERQVQVEMRAGEQGVGIGAHGVKRDVAEIQQAGEPHDDVQAQGEQDVQDGVVRDAHPAGADLRQRKGQQCERDTDQREPQPHEPRMLARVEEHVHQGRSP
jgi:hypothetical protein